MGSEQQEACVCFQFIKLCFQSIYVDFSRCWNTCKAKRHCEKELAASEHTVCTLSTMERGHISSLYVFFLPEMVMIKCILLGSGQMTWQLRVLVAFVKGPSLVSSKHITWLMTTCSSSSNEIQHPILDSTVPSDGIWYPQCQQWYIMLMADTLYLV